MSPASTPSPTANGRKPEAVSTLTPPTGTKRKRRDPDLETLTIDPHYDLTLIVGTPEHPHGQKAFRVSKSSMRHVSDVWTAMLTGDWAESSQKEIEFPDDSWESFLIVLNVAHFQISSLPENLNLHRLHHLALLTDRYNLSKAVRIGLDIKQWLHKFKDAWTTWPSLCMTQYFAFMTSVFNYDADFEFFASKLAVEVQMNRENSTLYHMTDSLDKITLKHILPDEVLGKIKAIRHGILQDLLSCCQSAVANASTKPPKCACGRALCAPTKTGILVVDLTAAGLHPFPKGPEDLHRSVSWYCRSLMRLGSDYLLYSSRSATTARDTRGTPQGCSSQNCFGDFGIYGPVKEVLQRWIHDDVFQHMQSDDFMRGSY